MQPVIPKAFVQDSRNCRAPRVLPLVAAALIALACSGPVPLPGRRADVIWVPTPRAALDRMLALAALKPGEVLYDLGCGDGRVVIEAARRYRVRAVGYEIDPYLAAEARAAVKAHGLESLVEIRQADLFTADLSPAQVIFLFLLPQLNERLKPQLARCRPGTRVLSHEFDMPGVTPQHVERVAGSLVYRWVTPLTGPLIQKSDGKNSCNE